MRDRSDRLQIEEVLARLPPGYRAVLVLHDIEGYTHREIAHLLGIDEGTARSQLFRARSTFRRWEVRRNTMHGDDNDDRPEELKDLPREMAPPASLRDRIENDLSARALSLRLVLLSHAALR